MLSTHDRTPWRAIRWGAIAAILVAPAIAMQFTTEMAWDAPDFALLALLLIGAGALYELTAHFTRQASLRLMAGGALIIFVIFVWADAAVGVL